MGVIKTLPKLGGCKVDFALSYKHCKELISKTSSLVEIACTDKTTLLIVNQNSICFSFILLYTIIAIIFSKII
jgi:hypothetical protein